MTCAARSRALEGLDALSPIALADLEATAALTRRSDTKYVLGWETFAALTERLAHAHLALEIDGCRTFTYDTVYFDGDDLLTFRAHVRGHRRRFKVRVRHYADTDACALEVKLKGRRGETVKHRLPYDVADRTRLTADAGAFLRECLAEAYGTGPPEDLQPVVRTRYRRATLVARDGGERLTCDFDLRFGGSDAPGLSPAHVIVEAKTADGRGVAMQALRDLGERPVSCSKYLMGVGLLGLRPVPNDLRRLAGRYFSPVMATGA